MESAFVVSNFYSPTRSEDMLCNEKMKPNRRKAELINKFDYFSEERGMRSTKPVTKLLPNIVNF